MFQCSSASRKFLNRVVALLCSFHRSGFSALQRAENSSIRVPHRAPVAAQRFQCSSASRKFLNPPHRSSPVRRSRCFSALQRAENSSIRERDPSLACVQKRFSALQRAENSSIDNLDCCDAHVVRVSVLFSEPKIPQFSVTLLGVEATSTFQCSSASRKFLNRRLSSVLPPRLPFQCSSASRKFLNAVCSRGAGERNGFQCSSASRKFLNRWYAARSITSRDVSVLFSEPKIPQWRARCRDRHHSHLFQCSSASRKFLNTLTRARFSSATRFQCSSASRKFLNDPQPFAAEIAFRSFSALQRAENSSITLSTTHANPPAPVSVLFSEPKIPQYRLRVVRSRRRQRGFSALQRAENSSIVYARQRRLSARLFQCSSASRKFLNSGISLQRIS